jgi:hypothetical protein
VFGLTFGLIMASAVTLEADRSFWREIALWVGLGVAFMLVGGWIRRRTAFRGTP